MLYSHFSLIETDEIELFNFYEHLNSGPDLDSDCLAVGILKKLTFNKNSR